VKTKQSYEVCSKVVKILEEIRRKYSVKALLSDRGTEFKHKIFTNYVKEHRINYYQPGSDVKAGIAERVNRTLQNMIYKYMTENETRRYIHNLDNLVSTYNNRGHRTLKYFTPNEAEKPENLNKIVEIHMNRYNTVKSEKNKSSYYKIGDIVRVRILKDKFRRGYDEQFSRELFKIVKIHNRMPIKMFELQSCDKHDIIQGKFYSSELSKVRKNNIFKIDKVLKKRVNTDGSVQKYVKWSDFGSEHNSWVNQRDFIQS
jgi:hypothetical protein